MRRRTNKSAKVPNVKLRPAQATQTLRANNIVCWAEDSQLGSDDTAVVDFCPRPFKGIVICATGVLDKPTLFKQALELGATSAQAFTDRVTHLVAIDHGGAKYNCAVERKIPILKPSWVSESYQIWLRGDDVDMDAMLEQNRLPVFSGVVLCPSGIQSIDQRTLINRHVTAQGGQYVENLLRPVRVTHLLCSGDDETDKMRYAEKFNRTGEAVPPIQLVWEEWFWDSLEFGGRFDEEKYQVSRPRPKRKSIPETSISDPADAPTGIASVIESGTSDMAARQVPVVGANPELVVDSNDQDEGEAASVKIIPEVTLQLWASLLKPRGFEVNARGCLLRSPTKDRTLPVAALSDLPPIEDGDGPVRSVIDRFRRVNSFAENSATNAEAYAGSGSDTMRRVFARSRTIGACGGNSPTTCVGIPKSASTEIPRSPADSAVAQRDAADMGANDVEMATNADVPIEPVASGSGSGIFAGLTFRALGEANCDSVRDAIRGDGGRLVGSDDTEVNYVLVRLASGSKFYHQEASDSERLKYRTECWLERCIYEERIVQPTANITFVPLGISNVPIEGASRVVLSYSGLDMSEIYCVKRLGRALGFNIAANFSRRCTHLLCPSGSGAKFDKAAEWRIAVVNMGWLEEIVRTGRIVPVNGWLVGPGGQLLPAQEEAVAHSGKGKAFCGQLFPAQAEANHEDRPSSKLNKGKGRANAPDVRMADITNTDSQSEGQSESPVDMIRPKSSSGSSQFGVANGLLAESAPPSAGPSEPRPLYVQQAAWPASTHSSNNPPVPSPIIEEKSPALNRCTSASSSFVHGSSDSKSVSLEYITRPSTPRLLTSRQLNLERTNARIPSSKSPSPLKVTDPAMKEGASSGTAPSSPSKDKRVAGSPPKISGEAARALQESITSLLGKRSSEDDRSGPIVGALAQTRAKRARPQRKASSTHSKAVTVGQDQESNEIAIPAPSLIVDPENPFAPFDADAEEPCASRRVDESVRVMYEDPRQREEKRKLLNMLNGGDVPTSARKAAGSSTGGGKPRPRPRAKGARAGGF